MLTNISSNIQTDKCKVFTPTLLVNTMLDVADYSHNLVGKRVLENSCGDGNILLIIVERYIKSAISEGYDNQYISQALENDIFAYEVSEEHIKICKERLNTLLLEWNIPTVEWNIKHGDYLKSSSEDKYDFIFSNPPYIVYRELDIPNRDLIRGIFETCKSGKFDYYYAFLEHGLKQLTVTGKMSYLVPCSVFKNQFAQNLRDYLLPHIVEIIDYTGVDIFETVYIPAAILSLQKETNLELISFKQECNHKNFVFPKRDFYGEKWIFSNASNNFKTNKNRFGEYFNTALSVVTLYNKAFVLDKFKTERDFLILENGRVEINSTRMAASPKGMLRGREERIIFPYKYTSVLERYSEREFAAKFPFALQYLKKYREQLDNRDSDENAQWFQYGRSQALAHLNQQKLMMSTIVTGCVNIYCLEKEVIPYSGFYIIAKNDIPLKVAIEVLKSDNFYEYVLLNGTCTNGISYRLSPKTVNNFRFNMEDYYG